MTMIVAHYDVTVQGADNPGNVDEKNPTICRQLCCYGFQSTRNT